MITGIFQLFGWVLNTCWTLLTAMLSLGWRMLTALLDFACRGVAALGSFLLGPLSGGTDSLWDSWQNAWPAWDLGGLFLTVLAVLGENLYRRYRRGKNGN